MPHIESWFVVNFKSWCSYIHRNKNDVYHVKFRGNWLTKPLKLNRGGYEYWGHISFVSLKGYWNSASEGFQYSTI